MPDLVTLLHQSIYVDDTVAGAANVNEAMELYEDWGVHHTPPLRCGGWGNSVNISSHYQSHDNFIPT